MTMTRSEAGLPIYELRKDVEDVSGPECKCVRMLLRQPMLSSFASLQHPQSALHSSTSSNPFLPRPPPDNDIAQPVGLSQWTNRCGHVHRRSGCKKGNACTYCHVHPITKAEDRNRPSKTDRGYGATRDLAMDPRVAAKRGRQGWHWADYVGNRRKVQEDMAHYINFGQNVEWLQGNTALQARFAVVTYHRELENSPTARCTAKLTEDAWGLPEGSCGVWLAMDAKSPTHFSTLPASGYMGFNAGIMQRVLPLFRDTGADLLIMMEAQCRWCDTTSSQQLPQVLNLCLEHPVTMVGYNGQIDIPGEIRKGKCAWHPSFQERPVQHRPPPKNCTPATAIRSDAIDFLLERMRKVDPRKMEKLAFDMFVLDNNYLPGIAFLSSPLAGQSSGRDPEAPVATGNWGRASGHKNTWIPCPPRVWSELKSMTMKDVQKASMQWHNSKKRRFK